MQLPNNQVQAWNSVVAVLVMPQLGWYDRHDVHRHRAQGHNDARFVMRGTTTTAAAAGKDRHACQERFCSERITVVGCIAHHRAFPGKGKRRPR